MSAIPQTEAANGQGRRLLVISYGPFSGIRNSLIAALRQHTASVVDVPNSLRYLRFRYAYIALLYLNAFLVYGRKYRAYLNNRTWAAQWARGRANQRATEGADEVDAVIALSQLPNYTRRQRGRQYAIYTDHTNLLSKQSPDYGISIPEQHVTPSWNVYERRIFQEQDFVFVPSRYVARSLSEDYGVHPERIAVVGAGPNLDVDCERDAVVKDYSRRNVLFVGADPVRKGLPELLQAFEAVTNVFPNSHLDVVGVNGCNTTAVTYHGHLTGDALKKRFYEAQVFVMPSLREPFGIVFLEAMWSKVVCIGNSIAAIPEIIEHGVTGFVVEPKNVVELTSRIVDLFRDPDHLRDMAEAGYRVAKSRWSWDLTARQILKSLFPQDFHSNAQQPAVLMAKDNS